MAVQPVYEALFGFHVFGLGFITSMGFIIGTGEPDVYLCRRERYKAFAVKVISDHHQGHG